MVTAPKPRPPARSRAFLIVERLEAEAKPGRPAKHTLPAHDKRGPLAEHYLAVYAPGHWYGYSESEGGDWQYTHQFVEWRRDSLGWVARSIGVGVDGARAARRLVAP